MASQFPGDSPPPITPPPPPYTPPPSPAGGGMVGRIQRIITQPTAEWQRIDAEPTPAMTTFTKWAVPLAAIGPIAGLIGMQVFGISAFGVRYHPPLVSSIVSAVFQYAGALAGVWILALIIDLLAPNFGSTKNIDKSMQVAAYSLTPGWIAGVLGIIPALGILALLAMIYGFYLFWVGLPILKRPPADKAPVYAIVTIVADIVAYFIIGVIVTAIVGAMAFGGGALGTPGSSVTLGSVSAGDGTSIDLNRLAVAGQQIAANAERTAQTTDAGMTTVAAGSAGANGGHVADPAALQAMLPGSIAGFTRTTVESSGGAAGGIGAASAKGTYTSGDQSFELSVADVGALGSLATLGGALNVNTNKQTATGYERTSMQNGTMVNEEWDNSDHRGKFSTMIASRFAVTAEGSAPSIDPLKAAVGAVDMGRLAALAH